MSDGDKNDNVTLSDLLKSRHISDQNETAVREMAHIIRVYHQGLRDEGFNAIEALTLTTNFQQAMIQNAGGQGK